MVLAGFTWFWVVLAGFGWFWLVLGGSICFSNYGKTFPMKIMKITCE